MVHKERPTKKAASKNNDEGDMRAASRDKRGAMPPLIYGKP